MTQEEKQLLLKDICARLPYGVMIKHPNGHCKLENYEYGRLDSVFIYADEIYLTLDTHDECDFLLNEKIKPYLRPMSSMTEEEIKEWDSICVMMRNMPIESMSMVLKFVNSKHLDYNNLIPKGLALEAPEGMYKF